jgi:hypothetical protein
MKKCIATFAIKEMQIKMTPRLHLTPVIMVIIKKTIIHAGKDAGGKGILIHC